MKLILVHYKAVAVSPQVCTFASKLACHRNTFLPQYSPASLTMWSWASSSSENCQSPTFVSDNGRLGAIPQTQSSQPSIEVYGQPHSVKSFDTSYAKYIHNVLPQAHPFSNQQNMYEDYRPVPSIIENNAPNAVSVPTQAKYLSHISYISFLIDTQRFSGPIFQRRRHLIPLCE